MIERNSIIGVIFQPGLMLNVHTVNRSLILPYSNAEMYDLANNVVAYHEFLPWCSNSAVTVSYTHLTLPTNREV